MRFANPDQRKLALLGGLVVIVGLLLFVIVSLLFPSGPPTATLRLADSSVQGTLGSYCWRGLLRGVCRDSSPPQLRPSIARMVGSAGSPVTITIGSTDVKEYQVTVRPWTSDIRIDSATLRELNVTSERRGWETVLSFTPEGDFSNHLLEVFVRYGNGDASYDWVLNVR